VNQETSKSCVGAVVVPDGVTALATKAFFMVPNMTSITLPGTLRSIGVDAFRSSPNLTSLNIPAGVTTLDGAFYGDTALTTITFQSDIAGSRLRTIGNETFEVTKLASINLPQGVESIGSSAFSNIQTLTSITLPPSLTSIGAGAFRATPITSITIPANVTSIGDGAFQNMPLNTVTFESGSKLTTLGASAFAGGQNITNFTFGTASQLTTIGASAFQGLSQLASITIPASVTSIGQYAFFGTNNLNKITFESGSQLTTIGPNAFEGSTLRNIVIPAGVTSIGNDAFRNVGSLWAVSFAGNSAPSVGLTTFLGIKNGARGFIKPGVTSFGTPSFNWNGLVIRESQIPPADNGDYSCATGEINGPGIKYTVFESQVTFGRNCTGSVVLAPGVLSIGANAFQQTSITSIVIPEGVTEIGNNAFQGITSLTSITFPESLKTIRNSAFKQATALTSITIPAGVTSIEADSFLSATSLSLVRFLGNTAPGMGQNAFHDVRDGALAAIETGVTAFGAIGSTWNKLEVINYETLLSAPANGFYSCENGLKDGLGNKYEVTNGALSGGGACTNAVVITEGVRAIKANAFKDAPLATISIPASVTSIGANAFFDNNSLTSFTVAPANANFSSIDGVLFNKNATTLLNYPVKSSATTYSIPVGVTTIADNAFRKATLLTSVTVPSGVTSIGASAFSEAYALTSINIPAGVTSIGNGAFGQTAITSINIPEGVTSIGNSAFQYARQLTSINIPASVTSIGNDAFFGNVSMTSITFAPGSQLTSIGSGAFWSSVITAITIPANVTSIGNRAFQDTVRLETVKFEPGSKLTTIGELAFYEAKVLTSISIPASVTTIGRQPFASTPELTEFFFLGNAPATLHAEAFTGVAATAKGYIRTGATGFGSGGTWNGLAVVVGFYEDISFNSNGGSAVAGQDAYSKITQPGAPTRAGYTFAGWTATNGDETTVTFPYAPSEFVGVTLYAKWTPNTYVVNWNSRGGTAVSRGSFVTEGSIATAPTAPTRSGYTFVGWTATNGGSTLITFPHKPGVIENISLFAKWTLNSYTVSWNSNGGTAVPNSSFVTDGEISSAPVTPTRVDHFFLGWSATDGGSVMSFPYAPGVVENITLYAKWLNVPPYEPVLNTYPTISGKAIQNTYLVATTGTWSALPEAVKTLQWYRCEKPVMAGVAEFTESQECNPIPGAKKLNYRVGLADQSKYLTVLTVAKNKVGSTESTAKSVLVPKATAPAMKSAPKISGSVVKGKAVTLSAGTWSANPVANTTQQWFRCEKPVPAGISEFTEAQDCVKISGATKSTYKVAVADQTKYLTALVTAKNSQGVVSESTKSFRVPGNKPTAKTDPKISGVATVGNELRATTGSWSALPVATTSLQWYRCAKAVPAGATSINRNLGCKPIGGATNSEYTVVAADKGKHVTVLAKAKNTEGQALATAQSVSIKVSPALMASPKISGSATVGGTLRATAGSWSALPVATTSLQWYRCSTEVAAAATSITNSMGCKAISGATKSDYKVETADKGKYLTVLVKAKNTVGNASSTAKSILIKVSPTLKTSPKISGSATVGSELQSTTGTWSGVPAVTTSLQWYRCTKSVPAGATSITSNMGCQVISGANRSQYTVKSADKGKYLTVLVKAKNAAGSVSATAKSIYVKVPVVTP
jgi:uncharacterized repeat protein (TIGR02543 family)